MYRLLSVGLVLVLAACAGDVSVVSPSSTSGRSTTLLTSSTTTSTSLATTSTTAAATQPPPAEVAWTSAEAEKHVENYLAALAAGAYEQAAFSVQNNGGTVAEQEGEETFAEFLERMCSGGACAGPYEVTANGPGEFEPPTGQASSQVTVVHTRSGMKGQIQLGTMEGQLVIADLPPLEVSDPGPSLVESLFGGDPPRRVVVQRFNAFEIWENGEQEWVTNWFADDTFQIEDEIVAVSDESTGARAVELRDPQTTYSAECVRLMERDGEVLALDQCATDRWHLFEVKSGDERQAPIEFQARDDGERKWFDERGGAVVHGVSDAEGNLNELASLDGVDLLGQGYAGFSSLSNDGRLLAYVDHADSAAISHFWSPVIVVVDTSSGDEIGRWTLDHPVACLQFSEDWVVACEVDDIMNLDPHQQALTAINASTGEITRTLTRTLVFLPG